MRVMILYLYVNLYFSGAVDLSVNSQVNMASPIMTLTWPSSSGKEVENASLTADNQ
jgi:hypothetical protein